MVSLEGITREHVRMAAAEINSKGVPEDNRSRAWYVEVDEVYYPSKYLI